MRSKATLGAVLAYAGLWMPVIQASPTSTEILFADSALISARALKSDTKTRPGLDQAVALDRVLSDMSRHRSRLVPALNKVRNCDHPEKSLATVGDITNGRKRQLQAVQKLKVNKIPQGGAIKMQLEDVLRASLAADIAFLAWARRYTEHKCSGDWQKNPSYKQGLEYSQLATIGKEGFIKLWNPIARKYGLKVRDAGGI